MSELTLEQMSGERKSRPILDLNEVRFNGNEGKFYYIKIKEGKIEQEDGTKTYQEEEIGGEVDIVFLKIRRRLFAFKNDEKPLITNEHNHKGEIINLFTKGKIVAGYSDTLREQYPGLRTQQIIYCLYNGELVRLTVKGSALGSKSKANDVYDFYSYISSFKKDGRDDHFYEVYTNLYPVGEKSAGKKYQAMTFKEGEKLDEEKMKLVEEKMKIAYEFCEESDSYYKTMTSSELQDEVKEEKGDKEMERAEETSQDVADDGEISPDDIPF